MKFLGRKTELKRLKNSLSDKGNKTILIYGRRRIGKSELIKHALADEKVKSIYYV